LDRFPLLTERASRIARVAELMSHVQVSAWFARLVDIAARVNLPEWWIGAGVIRDLVWGLRFGHGFDPQVVKDIDLGFFDPTDLSRERDHAAEERLRRHDPALPWDAKNQAAVHRWYPTRFGLAVDPFASAEDAVATFPEYATCVAIRRAADGRWDVAAPYGLDDLLDGVWRRNPLRVSEREYLARLVRKQPQRIWPAVVVVYEPHT
jgi:hypothetical protein